MLQIITNSFAKFIVSFAFFGAETASVFSAYQPHLPEQLQFHHTK